MKQHRKDEWHKEINIAVQTFSRAMIFGVALLYTMESWWIGQYIDYWKLLILFALSLLADFYLVPLTTDWRPFSFGRLVQTVFRNNGLAMLASALVLTLFGTITPFSPPYEKDLSTLLLLTVPVSIGGDIGQILNIFGQGKSKKEEKSGQNKNQAQKENPWIFILKDLASITGGALFVALPLSLTDEIPTLAARLDYWQLLGILFISLVIAYLVVYGTGMTRTPPSGQENKVARLVWPVAEPLASVGISLMMGWLMLYFFDRIQPGLPSEHIMALVIVLGLPASIGGAAGKLVL